MVSLCSVVIHESGVSSHKMIYSLRHDPKQFQNLWDIIVKVQNLNRILSQNGKGIMRIDQRIMDAKTKTIYRVTRIEEDLIILTAEDESDELVIRNNKSRDLK